MLRKTIPLSVISLLILASPFAIKGIKPLLEERLPEEICLDKIAFALRKHIVDLARTCFVSHKANLVPKKLKSTEEKERVLFSFHPFSESQTKEGLTDIERGLIAQNDVENIKFLESLQTSHDLEMHQFLSNEAKG